MSLVEEVKALRLKITEKDKRINLLENRVADLEQYTRMNDIIITGLEVKPRSYARAVAMRNGEEPSEEDAASVEQQVAAFLRSKGIDESDRREQTDSRGAAETEASLLRLRDLFPMTQSGSEVTDSLNTLRSKVRLRKSPKEVSPPTDFELMSSMMQKLTQLERKVTSQAQDIDKKTRRIAALEEKLKRLHEKTQREKQDEEDLNRKCLRLQKQVWEMEKFLNDYGMIWVGDDEDEDDEAETEPPGRSLPLFSGASSVRSFSVNFDLVLQNIRDLNVLAGEGGTRITFVPGGAKLTPQPAVDLQLYRNGMVMVHGPFRAYTEPQTQRFLQDLMDGFFPSELQDRFPHGVLFQVDDRRGEEFREEFPGKGHTVGGSEQEVMRYREEASESQLRLNPSHRKLSMQQFLNKLPECVVKGGNVIGIRSSLKHHLQGCGGAESCVQSVIETPALQTLRERAEGDDVSEISSLRVKSEDGEKTFILKMFFSETIGHLRQYLDAHRGSGGPPYDIISAFPHLCYHSNDHPTLLESGLTPNAALLLRLRPPVTS
ncbi:UBX domain-containing protein 11 [Neoarius graeffei]|uniref:UBX domain-containing protein 11 n=1 Tax=Neoarius graeffei TaxID=443677 RepID=UPI00298D5A56|nr:UBX domain-containing protein 11 [Neoarius graeffei]